MSVLSILQIGDNAKRVYTSEYKLTHCNCRINRTYDCCIPHSNARCEQLEMTVVAPGKKDLSIVGWFIENTALSGRLFITNSDNGLANDVKSSIEFEDAYCVSLSESYEIDESVQRQMSIVIVPSRVKVNGIWYVKPKS